MKSMLFFVFFVFLFTTINAQNVGFKFGLKVGFSQTDYGIKELIINDGGNFKINIEDAKVGFHGGATLQLKINKLIIQPEFLLNTVNVNYRLTGDLPNTVDTLRLAKETFTDLDIPLMIGFKSGALRLNAGPVGHIHLKSVSQLKDFKKLQWGWQAGIGFDFWILTIDIRYEGNFSKFGNHINFGNKSYAFSDNPQRLIGSLGVAF